MDHPAVNRANWDERHRLTPRRLTKRVARLAEDPDYLSAVVRFDLDRLGDIRGM